MTDKNKQAYYHVTAVGSVEGPVGMDIGIWLHFDTDQGKVKLKLSHEDAAELKRKLEQEKSIGAAKAPS
ncbi:MAG TPA: hypothetical protein VGC50_03290 [Gammaproteobacteria bacterium]|jgi:hypothetical protein